METTSPAQTATSAFANPRTRRPYTFSEVDSINTPHYGLSRAPESGARAILRSGIHADNRHQSPVAGGSLHQAFMDLHQEAEEMGGTTNTHAIMVSQTLADVLDGRMKIYDRKSKITMLDRIDGGFSMFLHVPGFVPGTHLDGQDGLTVDGYFPPGEVRSHRGLYEDPILQITRLFHDNIAVNHLQTNARYCTESGVQGALFPEVHSTFNALEPQPAISAMPILIPIHPRSSHYRLSFSTANAYPKALECSHTLGCTPTLTSDGPIHSCPQDHLQTDIVDDLSQSTSEELDGLSHETYTEAMPTPFPPSSPLQGRRKPRKASAFTHPTDPEFGKSKDTFRNLEAGYSYLMIEGRTILKKTSGELIFERMGTQPTKNRLRRRSKSSPAMPASRSLSVLETQQASPHSNKSASEMDAVQFGPSISIREPIEPESGQAATAKDLKGEDNNLRRSVQFKVVDPVRVSALSCVVKMIVYVLLLSLIVILIAVDTWMTDGLRLSHVYLLWNSYLPPVPATGMVSNGSAPKQATELLIRHPETETINLESSRKSLEWPTLLSRDALLERIPER
ncbi:hypothetical protein BV25DRAFT_1840662 [Artomyces pyxidatus]|uniref:Uncharacterized protein n=1 Tax=Artomyces pyxidatus TaxID=48021 RepID=A0ACB8ST94_9AGAM|nr:hypothetical protein BV25DRAFT_1840662 [Artomyces pyxidatus]